MEFIVVAETPQQLEDYLEKEIILHDQQLGHQEHMPLGVVSNGDEYYYNYADGCQMITI